MTNSTQRHPWNRNPYDLGYNKNTDLFVKDKHGFVSVDLKKRNWREIL